MDKAPSAARSAPPRHQRPVRVAVEMGDHHLYADARDDLAAPACAGPVLRHADPAGVGAVLLGAAVHPFGEAKQASERFRPSSGLKWNQSLMRPYSSG